MNEKSTAWIYNETLSKHMYFFYKKDPLITLYRQAFYYKVNNSYVIIFSFLLLCLKKD